VWKEKLVGGRRRGIRTTDDAATAGMRMQAMASSDCDTASTHPQAHLVHNAMTMPRVMRDMATSTIREGTAHSIVGVGRAEFPLSPYCNPRCELNPAKAKLVRFGSTCAEPTSCLRRLGQHILCQVTVHEDKWQNLLALAA